MDPISFYASLFQVSISLATVVNVALGTKAGQKSLDSTLKELPILHSLLEELKNGVLKTTTSIPTSAALATRACQIDLDALIECLSQRGLIGKSRRVFSELQSQLSTNSLESNISNTSKGRKKSRPRRQLWKERLHLLDVNTLSEAVRHFKDSVLLLRDIAMDLQTHSNQLLHSDAQRELYTEVQVLRNLYENPSSQTHQEPNMDGDDTNENIARTSQATMRNSLYTTQLSNILEAAKRESSASDATLKVDQVAMLSDTPKQQLRVAKFSTIFNIMVCIPKLSDSTTPQTPAIVFARATLDTGCALNIISQKRFARQGADHLRQKLASKKTLTLGDGKTRMTSEYSVTLNWYNTQDAMKSYTTLFYVVDLERDHFDLLLGKEFYEEHGAPQSNTPLEEYMMMGFLDLVGRPKEQKKKEKKDAIDGEKAARLRLQQSRDELTKNESRNSFVAPAAVTSTQISSHVVSPLRSSNIAESLPNTITRTPAAAPIAIAPESTSSKDDLPDSNSKAASIGTQGREQTCQVPEDSAPPLSHPSSKPRPSCREDSQPSEDPNHLISLKHSIQTVPAVSMQKSSGRTSVEDFALPIKTRTTSVNGNTGSSSSATAALEVRPTGSRVRILDGPQEVPRTADKKA